LSPSPQLYPMAFQGSLLGIPRCHLYIVYERKWPGNQEPDGIPTRMVSHPHKMGKVAKSGPWSSGRFINCNYTLSKIVIDTLTRTFSLNRVTTYSAGHVRKNYHSMQLFCPTAAFGLMSLLVYNVHGSMLKILIEPSYDR
jgi:hypothetical protein